MLATDAWFVGSMAASYISSFTARQAWSIAVWV